MRLIKISSKFQITIPKNLRNLCRNGWFAMIIEGNQIILKPVEVQAVKTEDELLEEIFKTASQKP